MNIFGIICIIELLIVMLGVLRSEYIDTGTINIMVLIFMLPSIIYMIASVKL